MRVASFAITHSHYETVLKWGIDAESQIKLRVSQGLIGIVIWGKKLIGIVIWGGKKIIVIGILGEKIIGIGIYGKKLIGIGI